MDQEPKGLQREVRRGLTNSGWEDGIRNKDTAASFYKSFQIILRKLKIDLKKAKVLEVGSGNAVFLNYMIQQGVNAVGVDSRARGPKGSLQIDARIEQLPFNDGSFDAIFSHGTSDSINYDQNKNLMMQEIARVLKHGGIYVGAGILSGPPIEELNLVTDKYRDYWRIYQKP